MIPERRVLAVVAALNARVACTGLNLSPRADRGEKEMSESTPQMPVRSKPALTRAKGENQ